MLKFPPQAFYQCQSDAITDRVWADAHRRWSPFTHCPEERPQPATLENLQRLAYEIVYWIEHTYNRRRRQRSLGKLTPVEFELAFTDDGLAA